MAADLMAEASFAPTGKVLSLQSDVTEAKSNCLKLIDLSNYRLPFYLDARKLVATHLFTGNHNVLIIVRDVIRSVICAYNETKFTLLAIQEYTDKTNYFPHSEDVTEINKNLPKRIKTLSNT